MKQIINIGLITLILSLLTGVSSAQSERKYYFTGLARVEMSNSSVKGAAYKDDTVSTNSNTGGVTLFDLGIHLKPCSSFKVSSIIRLQNKLGIFFGQGSLFALRQLKIEGLVAQRVKYELGDLDISMTPFTFYNFQDTTVFESSLFSMRRKISNYENRNESTAWRVQGAKTKFILFWGNDNKVRSDFETFAVRNRINILYWENNYFTGASLLNQYKKQTLGFNYVRLADKRTFLDKKSSLFNDVATVSLGLNQQLKSVLISSKTEIGISNFDRSIGDSLERKTSDGFLLSHLETKLIHVGLKIGLKYRYVGANFYSSAAQTLQINNKMNSALFPQQFQGVNNRNPLLFDRYSAPNIYNGVVTNNLMPIAAQYGNVLPYGDATPNRQGLSIIASFHGPKKIVDLIAESHLLNEISSGFKRSLTQNKLAAQLRVDSLLGLKKTFEMNFGFRNENVNSIANDSINFETNLSEIGFKYELLKNLDVLAAWKYLTAKGNEFVSSYNNLNLVETSLNSRWNEQQSWIAGGLQYNFSRKSAFVFHVNYAINKNKLSQNSDYTLNQYYLNYTLSF